jgi:uncharacterized membrane protein
VKVPTVRITRAGVQTALLAYVLMGLPLTFMMVMLWSVGGWRAVGEVILVTVVGTSLLYLSIRRYVR